MWYFLRTDINRILLWSKHLLCTDHCICKWTPNKENPNHQNSYPALGKRRAHFHFTYLSCVSGIFESAFLGRRCMPGSLIVCQLGSKYLFDGVGGCEHAARHDADFLFRPNYPLMEPVSSSPLTLLLAFSIMSFQFFFYVSPNWQRPLFLWNVMLDVL